MNELVFALEFVGFAGLLIVAGFIVFLFIAWLLHLELPGKRSDETIESIIFGAAWWFFVCRPIITKIFGSF